MHVTSSLLSIKTNTHQKKKGCQDQLNKAAASSSRNKKKNKRLDPGQE
jgi:hypothetical protein